jgi:tetratricopeptide (TPR) repeat protein
MNQWWSAVVASAGVLALAHVPVHGATDTWYEIKSPNFTVWSDASDGNTRTLVWQLEQIRSAVSVLWPWARVEVGKPMLVLAPRDEQSMKALVPQYWEVKGGVRPVSVWAGGADQNYLVIRADVRGDDKVDLNPHTSAYFSYVNLILGSSFDRPLPMWLSRGLAGVLSNTLVRENAISLGLPIPWHLEELGRQRMPMRELVMMTSTSPRIKGNGGLYAFDAQSWAFVHYLMFADAGAHRPRLNRIITLLGDGKSADAAFEEAFGRPEGLEAPFNNYISRNVFSYARAEIDAGVKRERFAARKLTPADAAGGLAVFHVAMGRTADARALIDQARKADAGNPGAYLAEALQFDRAGSRDEARAAYTRAVDLGSTSAYAQYRAAVMQWSQQPGPDGLRSMEKQLQRAVELNGSFAAAHAALGEVMAALDQPSAVFVPHLTRAVTLEPSDPWHRFAAARSLWRLQLKDDARKAAQAGVKLADTDAERTEAQRILAMVQGDQR